ncbi:FAD-dependent monooxygenase [Streptomyces sp. AM 2-1-1]|uniref:FAD-dependent monooxygenase n=1 Tax=unclassified Streptomyces TaxID=2593676 RepID=UPI0023B91CB8|nr:FAD-dependent monooxygenase [Streptomyces sp. AM 2-1-1]WEH38703.1 FAD-dependent monooxygenase [Streptomyces sp. AM 2-1-1]
MSVPTVVVVGAGPTGLALACGLSMAGVSVRVIDRAERPSTTSRALGLQPRGSEVLDRLGAFDGLPERSIRVAEFVTHVKGKCLVRLKVGAHAKLTSHPVLVNSQAAVEARLRCRLSELGVEVEWRQELTGAVQDADGVTLHLNGGTVRTRWLVGCDGAHSRVRKLAGIEFAGALVADGFLLADVRASLPLPRDVVSAWLHDGGMFGVFPLPGRDVWRLVASAGSESAASPTARTVWEQALRDHAGVDVPEGWDALWSSSFRIHRRLATRYRCGRILLAGDSAHVHSPFGGQGMNTGLGDAENLAWKLALVASGRARDPLLDTYEAERRPAAREVVAATSGLTRLAAGNNFLVRAARERVLAPLLTLPRVQRLVWEKSSQLTTSYRNGPLGGRFRKLGPGAGPRAGDRVPDLPCTKEDGERTRLHHELGPQWAVVASDARGRVFVDIARRRLGDTAVTSLADPEGGRSTWLVRPDGHLGWSGTSPASLDTWLARTLG